MNELIEAGALRNVVGRTNLLSQIVEALRYAQSEPHVGNVAVLVAEPEWRGRSASC